MRKMQPYIITTCQPRPAVDDTRHLGKLPGERSEQLLVAKMPSVRGDNASTMRADVAREGPFGSTRLLRPCKVHGNFRAVALLNPSVGKQRGVTIRWSSSIHGQHEPVPRKRGSPIRYLNQLGLVVVCRNAGLRSIRRIPYFPFEEIPEL